MYIFFILKNIRKFPGGSVVRIRTFIAGALGSIPGQGAKILQAARRSQKQERKILIEDDIKYERLYFCRKIHVCGSCVDTEKSRG